MTDYANTGKPADSDEPKDVPYELIPQLAADEDFIQKAERLRELKATHDRLFDDTRDKETGLPRGEFGLLKLELGARAMAAGQRSIAYMDLRIANREGGETKGKVTGASMMQQLVVGQDDDPNIEDWKILRTIALAAKDLDESILMERGIPAHAINSARQPGKPRSSSVVVEWIGAKGRSGGGGKSKATGGPVQ